MGFIHPGMLFTVGDLERIKQKVKEGQSPWIDGWRRLKENRFSQLSYQPNFHPIVYRNDGVHGHIGNADLHGSGVAVLYWAIIWYVTGCQAYADKAIEVLNGWADSLIDIGGRDQQLAASLYGYELLNGAEIIFHTNSGWPDDEKNKFAGMVERVFLPLTSTYGQVNNGWANGNWDAAATLFNMCLAIFTDNEVLYNSAVAYYKNGEGNGSIMNYIQTEYGQCQESGRDQAHAQLGIGLLTMAAKMGWNQRIGMPIGKDMATYPAGNNRLLKGIEYTAKYNLGYDVPYEPIPGKGYTLEDMGKDVPWRSGLHISTRVRGVFRPIYYLCYSLYVSDVGVAPNELKYALMAIERTKLEPFFNDHVSYGELLFALDSTLEDCNINIVRIPAQLNIGDNNEMSNCRILLEYLGSGNDFSIKSQATGKYLTVTEGGRLIYEDKSGGRASSFEMIYTGNGREMFKSNQDGSYLAYCLESQKLCLNPAMDSATSMFQILTENE